MLCVVKFQQEGLTEAEELIEAEGLRSRSALSSPVHGIKYSAWVQTINQWEILRGGVNGGILQSMNQ